MLFTLILGFILGAAAIIFILQNTAIVALTFMGWQFETSLALVVIVAIAVGFVLTLLITLPSAIGASWHMRKLRKHNEMLAREADLHKQAADIATAQLNAIESVQHTDAPTVPMPRI